MQERPCEMTFLILKNAVSMGENAEQKLGQSNVPLHASSLTTMSLLRKLTLKKERCVIQGHTASFGHVNAGLWILVDTTLIQSQHINLGLTESNVPLPHLSSTTEAVKQRCRRAGALPPPAGQTVMDLWNFSLSLEK